MSDGTKISLTETDHAGISHPEGTFYHVTINKEGTDKVAYEDIDYITAAVSELYPSFEMYKLSPTHLIAIGECKGLWVRKEPTSKGPALKQEVINENAEKLTNIIADVLATPEKKAKLLECASSIFDVDINDVSLLDYPPGELGVLYSYEGESCECEFTDLEVLLLLTTKELAGQ